MSLYCRLVVILTVYVTGRCGMSHAAVLWSLCKQFTATFQVSVTIFVGESPQIYYYPFLEGFIIVLFREDFLLRNYLNSFF